MAVERARLPGSDTKTLDKRPGRCAVRCAVTILPFRLELDTLSFRLTRRTGQGLPVCVVEQLVVRPLRGSHFRGENNAHGYTEGDVRRLAHRPLSQEGLQLDPGKERAWARGLRLTRQRARCHCLGVTWGRVENDFRLKTIQRAARKH